ncbi:MAG: BatA domain-containing protein [Bacteroidales bacterium]|nr:BatA domain-containing protein [Bacteroidales bacterium]
MLYFANPLMLIALVAVLIPIIIHLVKLRRYKKVYFSNTEMLSELQSEQRNSSRLREWLVLAARVLAITLLVLAFAQPKVRKQSEQALIGGTCVSVYIDNSYSMGDEGSEGILLEQAKKKAREIAAAYPAETRFQIVTNDNGGQRRRSMTREEFLATVDEVQLSAQSMAIGDAMQKQAAFATGVSSGVHAYVISDFQRSAWDLADSRQQTADSESGCRYSLVPLGATGQGNLYIDTVWLDEPLASEGSEVRLTAVVRNTGEKRVESLPVKLYVNGEQKGLASVDVDGKSQTEARLSFTVRGVGVMNGYVELTDYPITFDDRLYFSVNVRDRQRVLALHGGTANTYIRRLFDGDSITEYAESTLASADLSQSDEIELITLTSVKSITSGVAQTLGNYVEDGGTLLIAPPADCDIESYNTLLTAVGAPQIEGYDTNTSSCTRLNTEAALFHQVFRRVEENVELPTVKGYFTLRNTAGASCEEILTMANGAVYLAAVPCGEGVVYLFTAPLETTNGDFMQQALFVPTIYNMALYSRPTPMLYYTLAEGATVEVGSAATEGQTSLAKEGEEGTTVAEIRHTGKHSYLMADGMQLEAGNYRLSNGKAEQGLSFNYSRSESQMEFCSAKELKATIKELEAKDVEVFDNSAKPMDELIRQRTGGRSLTRWFLLGALAMLAAETLLLRIPFRKRHNQAMTRE